MISARSVMVIVRAMASGGGSGGGAIAASRSSARTSRRGSSGGASAGRAPASAGRVRAPRLAPEQADPAERVLGQAQAGVAMRAVEQQAGAELGLGVGAFVGERQSGRSDRSGAAASPGS